MAHWTSDDGLPQEQVRYITQTQDGHIWIATAGGLARFDGFKFEVFDRNSSPALPDDECSFLQETPDGLVVHGKQRHWLYTHGRFAPRPPAPSPAPQPAGASNLVPPHALVVTNSANRSFYAVHYDIKEDAILVAIGENVEEKPLRARHALPAVPFGGGRLPHCYADPIRNVLWLSRDRWIFRWKEGEIKTFEFPFGIQNVCADDTTMLFLATGAGLKRLDPATGETHGVATNTIGSRSVLAFSLDREGNLWCGTRYDGVYRLRPRRVRVQLTGRDEDIWCVAASAGGGVWIGTHDGISLSYNGAITRELWGGNTAPTKSIYEDRSGTLYHIGGAGNLYWWNAETTHRVALGVEPATGIAEDRTGILWLTHHQGIARREAFGWQYGTGNRLLVGERFGCMRTRDGALWVGSVHYGLYRELGGVGKDFTTNSGLPSMWAVPRHEDAAGTLWIATDRGLVRHRQGTFKTITTSQGLGNNDIRWVEEDSFGAMWYGTSRGVFRASKQELDECLDGKRSAIQSLFIGIVDGLQSLECNGQSTENSCRTADGRIWFATERGVGIIDPRLFVHPSPPPLAFIESVRVNNEAVFSDVTRGATHAVTISPRQRGVIEFNYTAFHFAAPEKLRFRCQLQGVDRDWVDAGARRVAYYPNVPPGTYQFRVEAVESHGIRSVAPVSVTCVVQPFFHETVIFRFGCVALLIAAAAGFHGWRLGLLRNIHSLKERAALDLERRRIAEDMHDDLGASLTEIALLSEVTRQTLADHTSAELRLRRISRDAREAVDNIGELVWATNPHNDTLDNLCAYLREHAARYFDGSSMKVMLNFPEDVAPIPVSAPVRREVFLVFKEALHNVRKHAGATEVTITITHDDGELKMLVVDNGRGFPAASEPKGNGLRNMRARVERLHGRFRIDASCGAGVVIAVQVPLAQP